MPPSPASLVALVASGLPGILVSHGESSGPRLGGHLPKRRQLCSGSPVASGTMSVGLALQPYVTIGLLTPAEP